MMTDSTIPDPRTLEAERAHQAFHREHNEVCDWDPADSLDDGCMIRYQRYREAYGLERGHSFTESGLPILTETVPAEAKSYVVSFHTFHGRMLEAAEAEFVIACADKATAEKLAKELNEKADKIGMDALAIIHKVRQAGDVNADDLLAYWIEQHDEDNGEEE